jgi:uncharacterized membrane protein
MFRTAAAVVLGTLLVASPALSAEGLSETPVTNAAVTAAASGIVTGPVAPIGATRSLQPRRSMVLPALYVSLSALQAYDVYSTLTAIKGGGAEANPFMKGVVGNPTAFVALKVGVTGASIYFAEKLWKDRKRTEAILLMVASNGLMAYVAQNNARVLNSMK